MTPLDAIMAQGIEPALEWLPARMNSPEALVMLLATGLQESKFQYRYQVLSGSLNKGPARSYWQMERGGGVVGVMTHPATKVLAHSACEWRGVPFEANAAWLAIENDDVLAAVFARLLYWSTPAALPKVGAVDDAWRLYVGTWRPGKPKPDTWPGCHKQARTFLGLA